MRSTTIRISSATRERVRDLARHTGDSMQTVIAKAVDAYRRQHFLDEVNSAYDALRPNAEAWAEIRDERVAWDTALMDGLAD